MNAGPDLDRLLERLGSGPLAGRVERNAPLGPRTTYRVGGSAAALVQLDGDLDVDTLLSAMEGLDVAVVSVGRGSNLLVSDAGFAGLALTLGPAFATTDVEGTEVVAGAAAKLPVVARVTVQAGLRGFEWAVGVPGSIGGAVRMNAGGHGAEIVDSLVAAEVVDLAGTRRSWRDADTLALGYRTSALCATDLVIRARLALEVGEPDAGKAEMLEIVGWRRDHQPGGQNAGSVFTNPPGDSAGRLIDSAGLKGLRIGTASVSTKHANFIQADPDGRADDVRAVMDEVVRRVANTHGVELRAETRMVGFEPAEGG